MHLSKRLLAVANMVTTGNRVVDVGTDHGYIPIHLVKEGKIPSAIAMDLNEGPLRRAEENIASYGFEDRIRVRLSDGVASLLKEEADTLVIAGMGGGLVMKILTEGHKVLESVREFVLQPQSEIEAVRRCLADLGYQIVDEDMVLEDGKYYPMMKVIHGKTTYGSCVDFRFGKILLEKGNPILQEFLQKELASFQKVANQLQDRNPKEDHITKRLLELNQEIEELKKALRYFE